MPKYTNIASRSGESIRVPFSHSEITKIQKLQELYTKLTSFSGGGSGLSRELVGIIIPWGRALENRNHAKQVMERSLSRLLDLQNAWSDSGEERMLRSDLQNAEGLLSVLLHPSRTKRAKKK